MDPAVTCDRADGPPRPAVDLVDGSTSPAAEPMDSLCMGSSYPFARPTGQATPFAYTHLRLKFFSKIGQVSHKN